VLQVYGSGDGRFDLYQDDGVSLDYLKGDYALTPIVYSTRDGLHRLVIGPTRGTFRGQLRSRAYAIDIHAVHRPESLAVDGHDVATSSWARATGTAGVLLPAHNIRSRVTVTWH
jgi:hypothetical protein